MEKIKHLLIGIVTFVIGALSVSASKCSYTELAEINREASGVKVTYEEKKKVVQEGYGVIDGCIDDEDDCELPEMYEYYFTINITNVTDDLYIKIINPVDNSTKILSSADAKDGVISFDWYDLDQIANLTIKVYTSNNTSCADEEVLVQTKTIPMYNYYSTTPYCESHAKESVCQKFVEQEITDDEFNSITERASEESVKEANKENSGAIAGVKNLVKENKKGFIIGGSIIIVVGVVTAAVVIIKRRRSRLI